MQTLDANTIALIACIILYVSIVLAIIALYFCFKIAGSFNGEEEKVNYSDELEEKLDYRWN